MNFILKPSLENMCLVKIATQLWTEDFIIDERTNKSNVSAKMREKAETFPLPNLLKSQLLRFIAPIGHQIYDWRYYLNKNYDVEAINLQDVRWTSSGTVDWGKSAQIILQRNQNLAPHQRYRLAGTFCLVEQLQEMPANNNFCQVQANDQDLVAYFTQHLPNSVANFRRYPQHFSNPNHEACLVAILACNPIALKYFFQKLNLEEKSLIISFLLVEFSANRLSEFIMFAPERFFAELVIFSLSQMSEIQRVEMIKTCAKSVFRGLLQWPYNRDFLPPTVERMREFIPESDLVYLMCRCLNCVDRSDNNCEYRGLFFKLWRLSSVECRSCFMDCLVNVKLFEYFSLGETEVCELILSAASAGQKEQWLLDDRWLRQAPYLARKKLLWDFFEMLIEACGSSREVMARFKTQLIIFLSDIDCEETRKFIQFLDKFEPDFIHVEIKA